MYVRKLQLALPADDFHPTRSATGGIYRAKEEEKGSILKFKTKNSDVKLHRARSVIMIDVSSLPFYFS